MKDLFDTATLKEVINRINKLKPSSERQWGTMEVSQMLAHCTSSLRLANGERKPNSMLFIVGILIGPFIKSTYFNEKPFKRNAPTSKESKITDKRDFHEEKELLIHKLRKFSEGGAETCTKHPHPFFGYLSPKQWAMGQ